MKTQPLLYTQDPTPCPTSVAPLLQASYSPPAVSLFPPSSSPPKILIWSSALSQSAPAVDPTLGSPSPPPPAPVLQPTGPEDWSTLAYTPQLWREEGREEEGEKGREEGGGKGREEGLSVKGTKVHSKGVVCRKHCSAKGQDKLVCPPGLFKWGQTKPVDGDVTRTFAANVCPP